MRLPRHYVPRNDGAGKTQIPLIPFAKGDSWFLNNIFIFNWCCKSRMTVYPKNKWMVKKPKKTEKGIPPWIPPQWGNKYNNSPPWRGTASQREGAFNSSSWAFVFEGVRISFFFLQITTRPFPTIHFRSFSHNQVLQTSMDLNSENNNKSLYK